MCSGCVGMSLGWSTELRLALRAESWARVSVLTVKRVCCDGPEQMATKHQHPPLEAREDWGQAEVRGGCSALLAEREGVEAVWTAGVARAQRKLSPPEVHTPRPHAPDCPPRGLRVGPV